MYTWESAKSGKGRQTETGASYQWARDRAFVGEAPMLQSVVEEDAFPRFRLKRVGSDDSEWLEMENSSERNPTVSTTGVFFVFQCKCDMG